MARRKNESSGRKPATRTRSAAVSEPAPPPYSDSIEIARVFQSGNSQAVRLPKRFRLKSREVQIFRRGRDIVLREKPAKLSERLAELTPLSDDAFPDEIPDRPPDPVEEL